MTCQKSTLHFVNYSFSIIDAKHLKMTQQNIEGFHQVSRHLSLKVRFFATKPLNEGQEEYFDMHVF